MITFRKLIGNINVTKKPEQQSSLDIWFERVIDVPIEALPVEDLCRAIRQELFIDRLMPRVMEILAQEPLAGEYYEGELIAALSTIKENELKDQKNNFIKTTQIINQLSSSDIDDDLRKNILKTNKIIV